MKKLLLVTLLITTSASADLIKDKSGSLYSVDASTGFATQLDPSSSGPYNIIAENLFSNKFGQLYSVTPVGAGGFANVHLVKGPTEGNFSNSTPSTSQVLVKNGLSLYSITTNSGYEQQLDPSSSGPYTIISKNLFSNKFDQLYSVSINSDGFAIVHSVNVPTEKAPYMSTNH